MAQINQSNPEPIDPVVAFWERIAEEVRAKTPEEHQQAHDEFWQGVFNEYQTTKQQSPDQPSSN